MEKRCRDARLVLGKVLASLHPTKTYPEVSTLVTVLKLHRIVTSNRYVSVSWACATRLTFSKWTTIAGCRTKHSGSWNGLDVSVGMPS